MSVSLSASSCASRYSHPHVPGRGVGHINEGAAALDLLERRVALFAQRADLLHVGGVAPLADRALQRHQPADLGGALAPGQRQNLGDPRVVGLELVSRGLGHELGHEPDGLVGPIRDQRAQRALATRHLPGLSREPRARGEHDLGQAAPGDEPLERRPLGVGAPDHPRRLQHLAVDGGAHRARDAV